MDVKSKFKYLGKRSLVITWFDLALWISLMLFLLKLEAASGVRAAAMCIGAAFALTAVVSFGPIRKLLCGAGCAFTIGYVFIAACICGRFTPDLKSYVWHDDAPMYYYFAKQGTEMFLQGGMYGWNSTLLGGYPAFLDQNFNMALFAWPLMLLFGGTIGVNLFVFLTIMAYPLLSYLCIRTWFPGRKDVAVWGLYFAFIFLHTFFWDFLGNCTFNRMLGIDLYIVNLALAKRFLVKKPLSSFCLLLGLALSGYAHASFFMLALLTLFMLVLLSPHRKSNLGRAMVVIMLLLLCILPYGWQMLRYHAYYVANQDRYSPPPLAGDWHSIIPAAFNSIMRNWFFTNVGECDPSFFALCFLPLWVWVLFTGDNREIKMLISLYLVLSFVIAAGLDIVHASIVRMTFALPILCAMLLALVGAGKLGDGGLSRMVARGGSLFVLCAFSYCYPQACFSWTTPRLTDLKCYSSDFVARIGSLDGNLVLFEGQGGLELATESKLGRRSEKWSDDVHHGGVFAVETGKNFFSTTHDGFHPSVFRSNMITSGTYKGRFLSEYPPAEIGALLKKWGIKYLVVWSNEARGYFGRQPSYKRIWGIDTAALQRAGFEPVQWDIYEFLDADPRRVVVSSGTGEIETKDHFTKILRLKGVKKGEDAIVRMNYFPAWMARWAGGNVDVFNESGQLALRCPADGDPVVYLYFPKYKALTMLAILSLLLCFFLSRRGYV